MGTGALGSSIKLGSVIRLFAPSRKAPAGPIQESASKPLSMEPIFRTGLIETGSDMGLVTARPSLHEPRSME